MLPEPATTAFHESLDWLEQSSLVLLGKALAKNDYGRAAVVSSFGADSAVMLHMVSRVRPDAPVLFIDTRMMFQETLDYQKQLAAEFGLTNVQIISVAKQETRRNDVFGRLHLKDTDACCNLRKTIPLQSALVGYDAWINGRKRHQSATRSRIKPVEAEENGRVKINPMLHWDHDDVTNYMEIHNLPRHPLTQKGYHSIGCAPCTARTAEGADPRSGRWQGQAKTECGIHISGGKVQRTAA
jgi:phosphoadenosine phosphosulfate reductase